MLESVLEIQNSLIDGYLSNLLVNMDGRLADLVTINSAILMQLGGKTPKLVSDSSTVGKAETGGEGLGASVGASPGQILALGVAAPLFGIGLNVILSAVRKHQDIEPKKFDAIIAGIDKFAEVVEKLQPAVDMMKEIPGALLKMAGAIILFGLALVVSFPLYMLGIFAMPLIAVTIGGFIWILSKMNPDSESGDNVAKGGRGLLFMSAAILIFGIALVVAGALYQHIVKKEVAITVLVIFAFMLLFGILGSLIDGGSIEKGGKGLMWMGAAILLFAIALLLTGKLAIFMYEKGLFLAIVAVVIGVLAFMFLIGYAVDGGNVEKGGKGLMYMAAGILLFSIALYLSAKLLPTVGHMIGIGLAIAGFGAVFYVIGLVGTEVKKGASAMLLVGVAMIVISLGLFIMAAALPDLPTALGILAMIAGLGLIFGIAGAGPVPGFIMAGAAAMIVVGVALVIIGAGVAIMAAAIKDLPMEKVLMMGGIILGLGLGFAGLGLAAPFILMGAGAMIVAGVAIGAIGLGIRALVGLDFSALGAVDKKGKGPFNWSGEETSGFLGMFKRKKTNLEVAIEAIADSVSLGPMSIMGIMFGAPAIMIAGISLTSIAKGILEFDKVSKKIDMKTLGTNIAHVLNTVSVAFATIGDKSKSVGGLAGLLGKTRNPVADGINAVKGMGKVLTNLAGGIQSWADLKYPTEWDDEGRAVSFRAITNADMKKVAENIRLVLGVTDEVFSEIGNKTNGSWLFSSNPVSKGIKAVRGVGEVLGNIATGIQAWADLKYPIEWDKEGKAVAYKNITTEELKTVNANIKSVLGSLSVVFQELGESNGNTNWFRKGKIEKGINSIKGVGTELGGIATAVKDWANLTYTEYDEQGNEIKKNLTDTHLDGAVTRMKSVIQSLTSVLGDIGKNPDAKRGWFGGKSTIDKGIEVIKKINNAIGNIAEFVKGVAEMKDAPTGTIKKVLLSIPDAITAVHEKLKGKTEQMLKSMKAIDQFMPPLAKLGNTMKKHNETYKSNKDFGKNVKRVLSDLANATNTWFKKTGEGDLLPMMFLKDSLAIIVQPLRFLSNAIERYGKSMRENTDFGKNIAKILTTGSSLSSGIMKWFNAMNDGDYAPVAFFAWSWNVLVMPIRRLANAIERYGEVIRMHTDFGENFKLIITPLGDGVGGMAKKVNMADVIITGAMANGVFQATKIIAKAGAFAWLFEKPLFYFTDTAWPKIMKVLEETATVFKDVERYVTRETATQYGDSISILTSYFVQTAVMLSMLKGHLIRRVTDDYIPAINDNLRLTSDTFKKYGRYLKPQTGKNVGLAIKLMMQGLSAAFAVKWGWKERRRFRLTVGVIQDFAEDWKNMEKAADAMERLATAQVKWTGAINDLDPELLTETRQMFDSFAILASTRSVERIIAKFGESMEDALTRLAEYIMALAEQMPGGGAGAGGDGPAIPGGIPIPGIPGKSKFAPPVKDKTASEVRALASLLKSINTTLRGTIKVKGGTGFP